MAQAATSKQTPQRAKPITAEDLQSNFASHLGDLQFHRHQLYNFCSAQSCGNPSEGFSSQPGCVQLALTATPTNSHLRFQARHLLRQNISRPAATTAFQ